MSQKHRRRKPFDWLSTYQGRRGTLALIRRAIREGWMDGTEHCDRRGQLVAAIHRLPLDRLDAGEAIGVFNAYLGMDEHNIDILRAEIKAEIAAHRSRQSPAPPKPCRER